MGVGCMATISHQVLKKNIFSATWGMVRLLARGHQVPWFIHLNMFCDSYLHWVCGRWSCYAKWKVKANFDNLSVNFLATMDEIFWGQWSSPQSEKNTAPVPPCLVIKGVRFLKNSEKKYTGLERGLKLRLASNFGANLSFILSFFLDCLQPISVVAVCTAAINIFKP
jgi:hypothetical protein